MELLLVFGVMFALLWVVFILPQQRRVRAHQQLVASLEEGDEVILTAGIYGRITELNAEDLVLEVAPGVGLRVARQAVLRKVETLPGSTAGADSSAAEAGSVAEPEDDAGGPAERSGDEPVADAEPGPDARDRGGPPESGSSGPPDRQA